MTSDPYQSINIDVSLYQLLQILVMIEQLKFVENTNIYKFTVSLTTKHQVQTLQLNLQLLSDIPGQVNESYLFSVKGDSFPPKNSSFSIKDLSSFCLIFKQRDQYTVNVDSKEVEVKRAGNQQVMKIKLKPKVLSSQNSFISSNSESAMIKIDPTEEFQVLELETEEEKVMKTIEGKLQKKLQQLETKVEDQLTNKLAHFQSDIADIKNQLKSQNEKVQNLELKMEKIMQKLNSKPNNIISENHPFNPVLQYPRFQVFNEKYLKYIGQNWNQYPFLNFVMRSNQDVWCSFQIRLHNITNKKIAVGIVDCLQAIHPSLLFDNKNKNCLGYHLGNGKVIKGHIKGLKCPKGGVVTMMINTHLKTIIWYGNDEELARQNWKKLNKPGHYFIPFIEMIHKNDVIEFVSASTGDV